eukprot:CAMPEP_0197827290 /NCGR_PEP_ID=MMETSP1437-20131217/4106_1 /TAXON_ID=49252 ORGANISM="Eucampia antarctica, Strain CCMP1452" /NCGR_SAMPLE_ID=MMETSP1437 /ASSEMBLY_ACC=CAM_ASM_001096 /LENGTH=368 /DNA_ID=CAMNT_0043428081 /DNA_START=52 /DNA_END=1158 /DNA_ORIENTATION=+
MSAPDPDKKTFAMQTQSDGNSASFKLMLLALMVVQNSSTVLIGRYTRSTKAAEDLYIVNHLIIAAELGKLVLSCLLEMYESKSLLKNLKIHVLDHPLDCLKISIPSMLYLLQNTLLYVALTNLTAPMFQVTYQTKLLTTALLSKVMLDRKYSLKQWTCLATLGFGVAFVVLGAEKESESAELGDENEKKPKQDFITGLIAISIACMSSALAGVYFEKVLKKPKIEGERAPASMWMRNIQMACFSVIIAFIQFKTQKTEDADKPFLHGFNTSVWLLVGCQSFGGLLVAAVIKYADNVLKGMATGVSVVLSTACSTLFFGTVLTMQFGIGAIIILISVYLFTNDCPACLVSRVKEKPDMLEQQSLTLNKV